MLYVVTEIEFGYDDQYFSAPEWDGGKPIKVFRSKEKAENYRWEVEAEFWLGSGYATPDEFYHSGAIYGGEIFQHGWIKFLDDNDAVCLQVLEEDDENIERHFAANLKKIGKNWSAERRKEFVKNYMNIYAYTIHEVEADIVE